MKKLPGFALVFLSVHSYYIWLVRRKFFSFLDLFLRSKKMRHTNRVFVLCFRDIPTIVLKGLSLKFSLIQFIIYSHFKHLGTKTTQTMHLHPMVDVLKNI